MTKTLENPGEPTEANLFTQSLATARKVLPFMGECRIAPTPENYMLWYEYFQGHSPKIKKRLDGLLKKGTLFSPELSRQLFNEFFGPARSGEERRHFTYLANMIRDMAATVIKESVASIEKTSAYSASLQGYMDQIDRAKDLDDLTQVLGDIITETQRVQEINLSYQRVIEEKTNEVNAVAAKLKTAEHEAVTDPLTGLANRRAFDRELEREFARARRYGDTFGVLFADLDDFKQVNDQYGHAAGDKVLQQLADIITEVCRGVDFPARYGGEEFVIILPGADIRGARRVAERFHMVIHKNGFDLGGQLLPLTISIGGSSTLPDDKSPDEVVLRADHAMLLAKRQGKDRVICFPDDTKSGPSDLRPADTI